MSTHESFPRAKRRTVFEDDGYKCRLCGEKGLEKGGTVPLEAHHIEDDPVGIDYHDPENGTTLCVVCHHYVTNRIPDELPFDLDEIECNLDLLTYDFEILSVLSRRGPSTIPEIVTEIENAKSENATRERLWHLMGHDQRVEQLTHPLVDQDVETAEWGLPHQIERSARGRIPDDKNTLIQRIEDEMVRRLLDYGLPREEVADIADVHPRTTHHREKRARAYRLPLGDSSEASIDPEPAGFETLETFLKDEPSSQGDTVEESPDGDPEPTDESMAHELIRVVDRLNEILEDWDERKPTTVATASEELVGSS